MAKTAETLSLERDIYEATKKQGTFSCFEVTIGWYGKERVDYITYDTKGIWRCYEIKVSKADFYSKAKKTFIGHFNYYVLTKELYELVKQDIPPDIGVYAGRTLIKRPRKRELLVDEQVLKNSLIRCLSRDADKLAKSENPDFVNHMNRMISHERREKERYREQYQNLLMRVHEKYGSRWDREGG